MLTTPLGRISPAFLATTLAIFGVLLSVSANTFAAITPTGDYTPTYNGTDDPWDIGGASMRIGDTGTGNLTIDAGSGVSNSYAYLGYDPGSNGTATVAGAGSTWNVNGTLATGYYGTGTLLIEDGGTVSASGFVAGDEIGSSGAATVTGTDSTLMVYNNIHIGYDGDGSLLIDNGGRVHNYFHFCSIGGDNGATGTVTVRGLGSVWDEIRDLSIGTGTLNIESGGSVSNYEEGVLGSGPGTTGTAIVTGLGSEWVNSSDLYVGSWGDGTLRIENGGTVTNSSGYITDHLDSVGNATVTGTGSTWNNLGHLHVGNAGQGTLLIENGGTVLSSHAFVGGEVGATGDVTVTGQGSNWTSSGSILIGDDGDGTMMVTNGATVSNTEARIGTSPGSTGTVTVTGSGSVWSNSSALRVGYAADGVLNIENGGIVNSLTTTLTVNSDGRPSSGRINFNNGVLNTGTMTASGDELHGTGVINTEGLRSDVDLVFDQTSGLHGRGILNSLPGQNITINVDMATNPGTQQLGVGHGGDGTLLITDGNVVNSTWSYLGYHNGSSGDATVSGTGSQWITNNKFFIGFSGEGTLTIENGGSVSDRDGRLAEEPGSTGVATVSGPGSTWINSERLQVGFWGNAELVIENGGTVSNHHGMIGYTPDSISSASVSGSGSAWHNGGNMTVGRFGTGELNITSGGEVNVNISMTLGLEDGSAGTVNLEGGTLNLNGSTLIQGTGAAAFNFTGGTLSNVSEIGFDLIQQGGTFAPGDVSNATDITGDYGILAGTTQILLGGTGNPIGLISVSDDIHISSLNTTLDLRALGPMSAGTYTVLSTTGGTITGMFDELSLFNLFGVGISVANTGTEITITLDGDLIFADANTDGFVGIGDLNIVLGHWNQNVTTGDILAGDLNHDGFVGIDDLTAVLGHWNQGAPPNIDLSASVPEPASMVILLSLLGTSRKHPPYQA